MLIWIPVAAFLAVSAPAWADGREGDGQKKVSIPKPVKAVKAKKIKRAVSAPAPQKEAVQPVAEAKKAEAKKTEGNAGKKKEAAGVPVPATAAIKTEEIKPAAVTQAAIKEPKKSEPPKPVPPIPSDYVMIESKPPNAELLVDGFYVGSTPLQIPLKDGAHMVKLVYPGYEEWERKVSVYRGLRVTGLMTEKPKSVASAQQ